MSRVSEQNVKDVLRLTVNKFTKLSLVKDYIIKEGRSDINNEFIESWFEFFNTDKACVEYVAESIIGEYEFATGDFSDALFKINKNSGK